MELIFDFLFSTLLMICLRHIIPNYNQLESLCPWFLPGSWKGEILWHNMRIRLFTIQSGPVIPRIVKSLIRLSRGSMTQTSGGFKPQCHVANNCGKTWEFKWTGAKLQSYVKNEGFKASSWDFGTRDKMAVIVQQNLKKKMKNYN